MVQVVVWPIVKSVLAAVGDVLFICFLGWLMVQKRILTVPATKSLGDLAFHLLLPCLLFYQLGSATSWATLSSLWLLPAVTIFHIGLSFMFGIVCWPFVRGPDDTDASRRVFVGSIAFTNSGNLPLIIIHVLVQTSPYFVHDEGALDRGLSFLFLMLVAWNLCFLSFGDRWIFPRLASTLHNTDSSHAIPGRKEQELSNSMHEALPIAHDQSQDVDEDDRLTTPLVAPPTVHRSPRHPSSGASGSSTIVVFAPPAPTLKQGPISHPENKMKTRFALVYTSISKVVSPPLAAMFVAIAVGLCTPVKGWIFGDDAPLKEVLAPIKMLGNAVVPIGTLVLASQLSQKPVMTDNHEEEKRQYRATFIAAITVLRLIVLPFFAVLVMLGTLKAGLMPPSVQDDPMFRLMMMLPLAMPSPQNLALFAVVHNSPERHRITHLLLVQYLCSILSVTGFLVFFQYLMVS
mmetsp:Transcript_44012/g.71624  ORF Transcript_44012/g.71624 Transcript_44012/m.71624 type:complete len:460 (-) Transcript_44012:19-1398(-)